MTSHSKSDFNEFGKPKAMRWRGMAERLNSVGIPTATGEVGKWRLSQVQRVLARLEG